jgi:hypothetical protein
VYYAALGLIFRVSQGLSVNYSEPTNVHDNLPAQYGRGITYPVHHAAQIRSSTKKDGLQTEGSSVGRAV